LIYRFHRRVRLEDSFDRKADDARHRCRMLATRWLSNMSDENYCRCTFSFQVNGKSSIALLKAWWLIWLAVEKVDCSWVCNWFRIVTDVSSISICVFLMRFSGERICLLKTRRLCLILLIKIASRCSFRVFDGCGGETTCCKSSVAWCGSDCDWFKMNFNRTSAPCCRLLIGTRTFCVVCWSNSRESSVMTALESFSGTTLSSSFVSMRKVWPCLLPLQVHLCICECAWISWSKPCDGFKNRLLLHCGQFLMYVRWQRGLHSLPLCISHGLFLISIFC